MKLYLDEKSAGTTFQRKTPELKKMINEAIFIIESLGTPVSGLTARRLERMALSFLALGQMKKSSKWENLKGINDGISMKSRDIINYINEFLEDKISSGSYDDIRRKDLKLLLLNGTVERTKPSSARNDSTRGYAISDEFSKAVREFGSTKWGLLLQETLKGRKTLTEKLSETREIGKVPIILPTGTKLGFSPGTHNLLQKKIIEDFLPRFGHGAQVLYVGDTAQKFLFKNEELLRKLDFFELSHGELPDIVAYSESKNWLFLIEAVHVSGPISRTRLMELKELARKCKAELIYVTAFLDRSTFRKFVSEIAWETEVWIAESPDHLVHFNGDKFMGPYRISP